MRNLVPAAEVDPEIAKQVLSYFMRNPHSADTLEGIASWRLLEERLQRTMQQTDTAVRWLVTKGFLQEIVPAGSVKLYRLDPKGQENAAKFLATNRVLKGRGPRSH